MRRRAGSAVVVAAVAAVALLALVDVFRPLRPEPARPLDAKAAARLAELGFAGTLVFVDPECRLHALALPELLPVDPPEGKAACEVSVSPDGRRVGPASARWSAEGQRCDGVCAWRGEELTFVRDGAIRSADDVLVSRSELAGAAEGSARVVDLAWRAPDEVAVLIQVARAALVAVFRRGRHVEQRRYAGSFDRLVVASTGEVLPEPPPRPYPFLSGQLRLAGPFDWSPAGDALAVATGGSVFLVDLGAERHVRIPVTARDLAWR